MALAKDPFSWRGIGIRAGSLLNGLRRSIFISDKEKNLHSRLSVEDEQEAHVNDAKHSEDIFSLKSFTIFFFNVSGIGCGQVCRILSIS